jgi:drug/metabolite transporter (DMT)-like permease
MSTTSRTFSDVVSSPNAAARGRVVGGFCVLLTALGWGLNWPATKLLITACPPLSARGVCGIAASLILFGVAIARRESLVVPPGCRLRLGFSALLNVTIWMGGTTASLKWLPAGQAATLAYTMPIWVCLLAWPILGERPSVRHVLAIAMGIGGVATLFGPMILTFNPDSTPGVALALAAAVAFAVGTAHGKARPLPLGPFSLTAWQIGLGSIPLVIAGFTLETPDFAHLSLPAWLALGYTALVSMGLCYVTWFIARGRLSSLAAATGTLLTPVVGVAASALALGEALPPNQLVSLCLVAGGIMLAATAAVRPAGPVRDNSGGGRQARISSRAKR